MIHVTETSAAATSTKAAPGSAWQRISRGGWAGALLGYSGSQILLAIGAFIRIPLIVGAIGEAGYGWVIIATGLCLLVTSIADGLSQSTRDWLSERESVDSSTSSQQTMANCGSAFLFTAFGLVSALCANAGQMELSAVFIALSLSSLALLGAPSRGIIEARVSVSLSHTLKSAQTLVGLPLLVLILLLAPNLWWAAAVTGLGTAIPFLACIVWARRRRPARVHQGSLAGFSRSEVRRSDLASAWHMTTWTWATTITHALDAAIIGWLLTAVASAEFGLANRIMTMALMFSTALNPLITVRLSQSRAAEETDAQAFFRRIRKLSLIMFGLSFTASAVSVLLGPWLAGLLGHGRIGAPLSLYVTQGVLSVLIATTGPLMGAFAGKAGVGIRSRSVVGMAVVKLALSVPFTAWLGVSGPIAATVVAFSLSCSYLLWVMRRNPAIVLERHSS